MSGMPKIKICGVTRAEDAELAAQLGAFAIGFIFFPKSPRFLSPKTAGLIAKNLPRSVEKVGVFVNPSLEEIESTAQEAGLTRIQLHGAEEPEFCAKVRLPVVKVLRLESEAALAQAERYRASVVGFLIDADAPAGVWGGTGARADWQLAGRFARGSRELWLAGGITSENAVAATQAVRPDGLDVSSGVESAPGIKDASKLRALFAAIQEGEKS